MLINPGLPSARAQEPIVPHGHDLQSDPASIGEYLIEKGEAGWPAPIANRFNHPHTDHRVVRLCITAEFTEVSEFHGYPVTYSSPSNPVLRVFRLLGGKGGGTDVCAPLRGQDREVTPAGADPQQTGPFADRSEIKKTIDLPTLRI